MEMAKSIDPGQPAQSAQADHGRVSYWQIICVLSDNST